MMRCFKIIAQINLKTKNSCTSIYETKCSKHVSLSSLFAFHCHEMIQAASYYFIFWSMFKALSLYNDTSKCICWLANDWLISTSKFFKDWIICGWASVFILLFIACEILLSPRFIFFYIYKLRIAFTFDFLFWPVFLDWYACEQLKIFQIWHKLTSLPIVQQTTKNFRNNLIPKAFSQFLVYFGCL